MSSSESARSDGREYVRAGQSAEALPDVGPLQVAGSQWAQVTATSKDERYPAWLPLP